MPDRAVFNAETWKVSHLKMNGVTLEIGNGDVSRMLDISIYHQDATYKKHNFLNYRFFFLLFHRGNSKPKFGFIKERVMTGLYRIWESHPSREWTLFGEENPCHNDGHYPTPTKYCCRDDIELIPISKVPTLNSINHKLSFSSDLLQSERGVRQLYVERSQECHQGFGRSRQNQRGACCMDSWLPVAGCCNHYQTGK